VLEGMNHVQFQVGSGTFTYGLFYTGFGLFATAYLLFGAFLAWCLGTLARTNPGAIVPLGWGFFILQVASLVLSLMYFLPPPAVLSALLAFCTGLAVWKVQAARA
jgi:hypothetical protein